MLRRTVLHRVPPPSCLSSTRPFSTTTPVHSRVGQKPIRIPPPTLGSLSMPLHPYINLHLPTPEELAQLPRRPIPMDVEQQKTLSTHPHWFTVPIQLVGVGYRAVLEQPAPMPGRSGRPKVSLKLGYSHPIELEVPEGVEVRVPVPTRLIVQGADLGLITQFAAKIRAWRPPSLIIKRESLCRMRL
ncbi:hypothetical protein BC829DRAFT_390939 [Chytridium lagenaria]|nr:hypothetical protein BC829DRAFT_390939 [Chytridium lagenaria]